MGSGTQLKYYIHCISVMRLFADICPLAHSILPSYFGIFSLRVVFVCCSGVLVDTVLPYVMKEAHPCAPKKESYG